MPVTKTRTKRYVAYCDLPDCSWSTMDRFRINVSERLRHHLKTTHGLTVVEKETRTMKQPGASLPEDTGLDKLSDQGSKLIAIAKGWTHNPAYSTQFGIREAIEADVFVWDGKEWRNLAADKDGAVPNRTPIFFKTVIRQLLEAGDEDDFGGILSQNVPGRKNTREWAILPASGAAAKALDKFDSAKLPSYSF